MKKNENRKNSSISGDKSTKTTTTSPTKKSITSINLFTLSTLIGTYRSACCLLILRVCKELKKKILSQGKYSIDFNTWWGHHNNSNPLICKSKIIVRVIKGQKLTKIVFFRIASAPFTWVRYTAFFGAATIRKKIKIRPRPFGSHEWQFKFIN